MHSDYFFSIEIFETEKMHSSLRFYLGPRIGPNITNAFFFAGKCIHIISFIKKPLRDETTCWHAALRVLRAEAPKTMSPCPKPL